MPAIDGVSRRQAVTGLSSVGVLSVVGCLGEATRRLTLGVGPVGSRSHQAGQALAVAADQHSDTLSLNVESMEGPTERVYAASSGAFAGVAVDNTTVARASESRGVFDIDPVDPLPQQGFIYGRLDHYWLVVADTNDGGDEADSATPATSVRSTAAFADELTVYPVEPSEPSRLVTQRLLEEADLWTPDRIDNRQLDAVPAAVEAGEIDCLAAVEANGRQLAPWCRRIDDRVGDRLAVLPVGEAFADAIETVSSAVAVAVEPTGWERAALPGSVAGWGLPMQWLFAPRVDQNAVAELTRIAHDHTETFRSIDGLALDRSEPAALAEAVIDGLPVHEGAATVFSDLGLSVGRAA